MFKILVVGISVVLLGACTSVSVTQETDWPSIRRQAEQIADKCRQRRLAGELPGKVASLQCAETPILELYRGHNDPYLDLLEEVFRQHRMVVEKVDLGEIDEAQEHVAVKALNDWLNYEQGRRRTSAVDRRRTLY